MTVPIAGDAAAAEYERVIGWRGSKLVRYYQVLRRLTEVGRARVPIGAGIASFFAMMT